MSGGGGGSDSLGSPSRVSNTFLCEAELVLIVFSRILKDENSFVSPDINLKVIQGANMENNRQSSSGHSRMFFHVIPC